MKAWCKRKASPTWFMLWHLLRFCKPQLKEVCAVCFLVITDGKRTAEMNKLRQNHNAEYKAAKADLELGLGGVQKALEVMAVQQP